VTEAMLPVEPPETDEGAVIDAVDGITVTFTAGEVPEHPLPLVTLTLYAPEIVAAKDGPVAPLIGDPLRSHWYDGNVPLPPLGLALSVTLPPGQKVVGPPADMVTFTVEFTVTETLDDVAEQPVASLTVTE